MAVDVAFEVSQTGDTFRVRTQGMARRGRPELELVGVESIQIGLARTLLEKVADSLSRRPVQPGRVVSLGDEISVELQEGEHVPAGMFARAFGAADRTVLRVTDTGAPTAHVALCSTARSQAKWRLDAGDITGAARVLHEALQSAAEDDTVTSERAMAFMELSRIERSPRRAVDLLLRGLRLCERAQLEELGATLDELTGRDARRIDEQMRRITAINLGLVHPDDVLTSAGRVVPSPVWQRGPDGGAELAMVTVPTAWLRLYWSGSTREELENGLIATIAARLFRIQTQRADSIARLAFDVRPTRATFAVTAQSPRAEAAPGEADPSVFLASAVLAQVARLRTAGLTLAEIDAAFGLNFDQETCLIARDKERRLRIRLASLAQRRSTSDIDVSGMTSDVGFLRGARRR